LWVIFDDGFNNEIIELMVLLVVLRLEGVLRKLQNRCSEMNSTMGMNLIAFTKLYYEPVLP